MFTCWNTKLSARASNYGTRIDYILVTPGLLPWIKAADIEPFLKGSDHCPVWIELHEEIQISTPNNGMTTVRLRDAMSCGSPGEKDPPRLATRFWDEYSGKQRLLASFFGVGSTGAEAKTKTPVATGAVRGRALTLQADLKSQTPAPTPDTNSLNHPGIDSSPSVSTSQDTTGSDHTEKLTPSQSLSPPLTLQPSVSTSSPDGLLKRKSPPPSISSTASTSKKQKKDRESKEVKKTEQSKLSTFFVAPSASGSKGKAKSNVSKKGKTKVCSTRSDGEATEVAEQSPEKDGALRRAIELSLSETPSSSSSTVVATSSASQDAWKSILRPPEPPRCGVHNEAAKELRVNKPGPNKGRAFWICSR